MVEFKVQKQMHMYQRRLDKHLYGLSYVRVAMWENSDFFSARSSKVKVNNFKQSLLGSVKVREVF